MRNFTLSHHLGMGDHIIMNGLVRHIYDREENNCDKFWLTCFDRNERNVRFMYRDLPKLDLIVLEDSPTSGLYDKINEKKGRDEKIWLDDKQSKRYYAGEGDDIFFTDFGYDKKLIQEFKCNEDVKLSLAMGLDKYVFIHDEGHAINMNNVTNEVHIFRPNKEIPILDYIETMRQAKEIHVISSSFLCLCIAMPELAAKTTAHLYARNSGLKKYVESKGIKVIV